jgi:hypothetical protein
MIHVRRYSLMILLSLSALNSFAQANHQSSKKPGDNTDVNSDAAVQKRATAIQAMRNFAERAMSFHDTRVKVTTLVPLAELLWKAGDADYARQLFLRTYDSLRQADTDDSSNKSITGEEKEGVGNSDKLTSSELQRLRGYLIQHLAPHDTPLAKQLLATDSSNDSAAGTQAYDTAQYLFRSGEYADGVEFAEQGLKGGIHGTPSTMKLLSLLVKLREANEQMADGLFLKTLAQIASQPAVDPNDLLIIGNYVFTSANISPTLRAPGLAVITPAHVGNVSLQADVSLDRPSMSLPIVRAYLNTAVTVLSRLMSDENERQIIHATSFLLIPKAQRYAPELAPQFMALASGDGFIPPASQQNAQGAPQPLASDQSVDHGKIDLGSVLRKMEAITDVTSRDQYGLRMAATFYSSGDLNSARVVAGKIQDSAAQRELFDVINFHQAAKSIEAGDLESADRGLDKVSPGLERVILRLGLARAYVRKGDSQNARMAIDAANKDINGDLEKNQKPFMMLAAAEIMTQLDATSGANEFREAVKAFNSVEGAAPEKLRIAESKKVTVGTETEYFDIGVSGLDPGNFYQVIKPLLAADKQGTTDTVLGLKDERVLSQGLLALSNALLN